MPNDLVDVSLFNLLRVEFGEQLQPLMCTKATLVHLSHTLEDLVLTKRIPALLFTGFQESSHWRKETERYRALAEIAQQVCIFAGGKLPPESSAKELHVTLRGEDPLRQEWFVLLLCEEFAVLLCGQDRQVPAPEEAMRQFETLWSFSPMIINRVLDLLERVVDNYRPERLATLQQARRQYPLNAPDPDVVTLFTSEMIRFEEQLHHSLQQTTAALNEQLRWRDDLTATLVHDMRSPLQGLAMVIDMLALSEQFDRATLDEMLAVAKRSTHNLRDLVQVILDTNQLAAGQLQVAWQPLQPAAIIRAALEPLQIELMANKQDIHIQIDERVKLLWADPGLFTRILQNLVGNAIKFTPSNQRIDIGVAPDPKSSFVEIRVRDTGTGINPSALPYIFDRFYQAKEGDRRGVGLGLYFCRLAAEAHGGTIRAASQTGTGTTITFTLPTTPNYR